MMAGKEAKPFERRIASLLAAKWDRPYSEMVGYVRGRMGLAIIRHNTRLLRRSRSKYREVLEIEDTAGYEAVREKHIDTYVLVVRQEREF